MTAAMHISHTISTKNYFLCKQLRLFGVFSGDQDDYVNVWIIKTSTKTDQMNVAFCFYAKWTKYKDHVCP